MRTSNPFRLIIFVPILFITLTALFITFIHVQQADNKFKSDYENLTNTLLDEKKLRTNTILESINSYITFKKASSTNILKDRIKSRVTIAHTMLQKLYNDSVGILPQNTIQINLLSSLRRVDEQERGKYFIYGIGSKSQIKNKDGDSNLFNQVNNLLKIKNEGFIFFDETLEEGSIVKKIAYIKKFESSDFLIGYSEDLSLYQNEIKEDVLNRLDLMTFDGSIYTIDENLNVLQHSNKKELIAKNITDYEADKNILYMQKEYLKFSKLNFDDNSKNKYYWKKIGDNSYKIVSFSFIKDWNWLVVVDLNLANIKDDITGIIGIKQAQRDESIHNSIKASLIFILIASIISYFISEYINSIIKRYRQNIERQKVVLQHLNSSLEDRVEEKTKQLQVLNTRIIEKFKDEVRKNREKDQLIVDQSKLAIMGEMIGNIAHQWRQPLCTISTIASGNTIKIDYEVFDNEEIKKDFELIVDTTQYLSETVDDFRNFFIKNKDFEIFDIVDVIEKDLNLVSSSLVNNYINVVKNYNSVEVKLIKNELLQAILNIINNAKDALLNQDESNRFIVIDVYENNNNVIIEIKDSAGGIKEEILPRIFDQYFTTKDKNNGTGIGLYMTKQIIVNNLNGNLEVKNQEFVLEDQIYKGACFKITLPTNI